MRSNNLFQAQKGKKTHKRPGVPDILSGITSGKLKRVYNFTKGND